MRSSKAYTLTFRSAFRRYRRCLKAATRQFFLRVLYRRLCSHACCDQAIKHLHADFSMSIEFMFISSLLHIGWVFISAINLSRFYKPIIHVLGKPGNTRIQHDAETYVTLSSCRRQRLHRVFLLASCYNTNLYPQFNDRRDRVQLCAVVVCVLADAHTHTRDHARVTRACALHLSLL